MAARQTSATRETASQSRAGTDNSVMDLHLTGKVAVVTGASKGIGLAITRALAEEGVTVVAGAREITIELTDLADAATVRPVQVDLAAADGPARLINAATAEFGGLDILVNNVGAVTPRTGGFLSVTDDDWSRTLNLDLMAGVRATRAALPLLLDRGSGTVVTIASVNSILPDPLVVDYCAAKAAVLNLSKSLSKEYGAQGIRFNTVSPGPVSTALWLGDDGVAATVAAEHGITPAQVAQQAAGGSVTGRFSRPDEVADLVVYLVSERAANITGADFTIDGGLIQTI
jgi:NAD(P)-dependent dehydrogenase (short-subunit alcohol dehydrogenase family)